MPLDPTFAGAALAGLLSFLSPCVLPLVPFYLCYLAGLSMQQLRGVPGAEPVPAGAAGSSVAAGSSMGAVAPALPAAAQRRLIAAAVAFALGVTSIFVLLGLGATLLGQALVAWQEPLSWLAAAVLALFGLQFLGLLRFPFLSRQLRLEGPAAPAGLAGAYVMGLAFGFGWTPCVGPALAAILFVAAGAETLLRGGLLLLTYGLAMTLPFVLAAVFARPFLARVARFRPWQVWAERLMGAMLLLFAALIATGTVNRIAAFLLSHFDWSLTLR